MKFSSLDNLEVGSIVGNSPKHMFFRCFPSMSGETIMDQTIIVEYKNDNFRIERIIDEECSRIAIMRGNQLWCLGAFGNLYILNNGIWSDYKIELKPYRYLNEFVELNGSVYSAGKNSTLLELQNYEWRSSRKFEGDYDFYAISGSSDKSIYVVGEHGCVYKIIENKAIAIDVPTNQDIYGIYINKQNIIHICGLNGCFFVGTTNEWLDLSEPNLGVSFHGMKFWNNNLLVAAKNQIIKYENNELIPWVEIEALSLWITGNILWAKGLNKIHYTDNGEWTEFVVEFEV